MFDTLNPQDVRCSVPYGFLNLLLHLLLIFLGGWNSLAKEKEGWKEKDLSKKRVPNRQAFRIAIPSQCSCIFCTCYHMYGRKESNL